MSKAQREIETPPNNPEAESRLLAALICNDAQRAKLLPLTEEADFYDDFSQKMFRGIKGLAADGLPPEVEMLRAKMGDSWDPLEWARRMDTWYPDGWGEHWLKVCRELSIRRRASWECDNMASQVRTAEDSIESIAELEETLRKLRATEIKPTEGMSATMDSVLNKLEGKEKEATVLTGYPDLDSLTGGMGAGQLIIVAGRPSMGKTTFALNVINAVCGRGQKVLMFSCEMSKGDLCKNILSRRCKFPLRTVQPHDWTDIARQSAVMADWHFEVSEDYPVQIGALSARVDAVKQNDGLDLVVVDYIQRIKGPRAENKANELGYISGELKATAQRNGVPILCLCQLNRDCDERPDHQPRLDDLKGSGDIEQDCDQAWLLYRPCVYGGENQTAAELLIAKQRNGPQGAVDFHFFAPQFRFEEAARERTDRDGRGMA